MSGDKPVKSISRVHLANAERIAREWSAEGYVINIFSENDKGWTVKAYDPNRGVSPDMRRKVTNPVQDEYRLAGWIRGAAPRVAPEFPEDVNAGEDLAEAIIDEALGTLTTLRLTGSIG